LMISCVKENYNLISCFVMSCEIIESLKKRGRGRRNKDNRGLFGRWACLMISCVKEGTFPDDDDDEQKNGS
jgi:hypothetical protein